MKLTSGFTLDQTMSGPREHLTPKRRKRTKAPKSKELEMKPAEEVPAQGDEVQRMEIDEGTGNQNQAGSKKTRKRGQEASRKSKSAVLMQAFRAPSKRKAKRRRGGVDAADLL